MTLAESEVTVDAFLGGMVEAVQPKHGHHRSGLEAVLLSAAVEAQFTGTVVDLGAGVGVAGMAVAARCPGATAILVERDPEAIACAHEALARPVNRAFAGRISIVAIDVADPESTRVAAGLGRAVADALVMNPPFHRREAGTAPPSEARASAHMLADSGLEPWLRTAASVLKPGGRLVAIFRADRLDALLSALNDRFGDVAILPVHPRATEPAHRVLVSAVKGSRAGTRILPALVLHPPAGSTYFPDVERILRHGAGLAEVHPSWASAGRG